jgi:hypothetical protein
MHVYLEFIEKKCFVLKNIKLLVSNIKCFLNKLVHRERPRAARNTSTVESEEK